MANRSQPVPRQRCRCSVREAYFDVFMTSVVGPMLSLVIVIALAILIGSF